eukprot:scaffold1525_cov142-Cylindrotheca_fusiformis.AAC.63
MAPIYAAAAGVIPQIIDDERLRQLQSQLEEVDLQVPPRRTYTGPEEVEEPQGIESVLALLEPWQKWGFEEQSGK